ncbi:ABC transporter ATP-binding protein [Paenibacillus sp. FSL W7-1279]|uniref:ABC transporter ATP-binding protein n=1 Tax=Paenibacillus sp. FSL W7-1279 TaxID=2921697 RepID=UPI0030D8E719
MIQNGLSRETASSIKIEQLSVEMKKGNHKRVVDHVNLSISADSVLGIVGESGSGKTTLCMALMGLLPEEFRITKGHIWFKEADIVALSAREHRRLRGTTFSMIMQNPRVAFNPLRTIGAHMIETFRAHMKLNKREASQLAEEYLIKVGLPRPMQILKLYPFQLSGGMLQRVMIGITMAMKPELIIADEPTTGLDASNRKLILNELTVLRQETGAAIVIVTHDLDVIAEMADSVAVMQKGEVVELAPCKQLFDSPKHEYTRRLLHARIDFRPSLDC